MRRVSAFFQSEKAEQEAKKEELAQKAKKWEEQIEARSFVTVCDQAEQESAEQFLYLRERIRYVLGDEFAETINVATVTGANKREQQQALAAAITEWRGAAEHFLSRELKAIAIRLEETMQRSTEAWLTAAENEILHDFPTLSFIRPEPERKLEMPAVEGLIALTPGDYLAYFKSPRAFF